MRATMSNPAHFAHRIELQQRNTVPDGFGGMREEWQSLAFLWARVTPINQTEGEAGDHLVGRINLSVRLRYRTGIVAGMRFIHRMRVLRIVSCLDEDESRRFLTCLCAEEK